MFDFGDPSHVSLGVYTVVSSTVHLFRLEKNPFLNIEQSLIQLCHFLHPLRLAVPTDKREKYSLDTQPTAKV